MCVPEMVRLWERNDGDGDIYGDVCMVTNWSVGCISKEVCFFMMAYNRAGKCEKTQ